MLRSYRRQTLVVTAVAVVAALASSSALAAPGNGKQGPRGGAFHVFGFGGPAFGGPAIGMRGFGGPGFRGPRFGGPMLGGMHMFGDPGPFGHRGPHGPGMLSGAILARSASYIGITPAQLGAGLKEGKTLAQIATANGKTAAGLVDALVADAKAGFDALVAAGWLTQARADKAVERMKADLTRLVNEGPKVPKGGSLDPAASYLGMTMAELHTALRSGKSLAEIATAEGKTVEGLVAALVADAKERLADAVADEKLTQVQADKLLAGLTERVTDMVNRKPKVKPSPAASTTASLKSALKLKLVAR